MEGCEHARFGINVFAEVLGADEGMVATKFANLVTEVLAIKIIVLSDVLAIDDEDALDPILLFHFEGGAFFTFEEGIDGPGGAGEDAGGISGGSHGRETLVVDVLIHVLGFVDDEQAVGSGANDIGGWVGGEVGGAGRHEAVGIAVSFLKPAKVKKGTLMRPGAEAIHGIDGLRAKGGLDADNRRAFMVQTGEEVEDEVGKQFVLAGLARKDDDKCIAITGKDRIEDGVGGLQLVGAELDGKKAPGKAMEAVEFFTEFLALARWEGSEHLAAVEGVEFFEHVSI